MRESVQNKLTKQLTAEELPILRASIRRNGAV